MAAPLFLYRGFIRRIQSGDLASAMTRGVAWAALLSAGILVVSQAAPEAAGAHIVHGAAYRDEMFSWIETGVGREGDWRSFAPQHVLHLGVFVALVLVSRGYLGLVLGALLLAYMNYFVASFAAASGQPWLGVVQAWFPWSVARVLAYIALGVVLSVRPRETAATPAGRRLLALAAVGLLVDLLLKAWLAPEWGLWLRSLGTAGGPR